MKYAKLLCRKFSKEDAAPHRVNRIFAQVVDSLGRAGQKVHVATWRIVYSDENIC